MKEGTLRAESCEGVNSAGVPGLGGLNADTVGVTRK